jgi:hypothetical protein
MRFKEGAATYAYHQRKLEIAEEKMRENIYV